MHQNTLVMENHIEDSEYLYCFKKIGIWIMGALIALILTLVGISSMNDSMKTRALTISDNENLSISSRAITYQPMLIAPYKSMDVFVSEEKKADFKFTSVGGSWEQYTPPGTNVEARVRFKINGNWSAWVDTEEEEDDFEKTKDNYTKKYAMASGNPAQAMQYEFLLYGDGNVSPQVRNAEWTLIKTGERITTTSAPTPKYSAFTTLSNATHHKLNVANNLNVVTRQNWGANESYRYLKDNGTNAEPLEYSEDFYNQFSDELQFSRIVKEDSGGNKYIWPLQYPEKVKKFVIHHTATTSNLDNPQQAIRDIYYYHAITRGWGDIGYNYIIDTNGKIYEGRYGGEGVIGAHAGPGNHGSIGISVLGNYETDTPSEKIIIALTNLIKAKSLIHKIDPDGYSDFRGKLMPNIFGHKDIMATTCPGGNLYAKLTIIRSIAAKALEEKPKFVKDYDYQDKSEVYYLELKPLETVEVEIKMENIGKVDWNDETFIVVNQNPKFENVVSFPTARKVKLAMMEEKLVEPGEEATFEFRVKAGKKGEIVYMDIAPLINGTHKIDDYIKIPITVQQTDYKYEFVGGKYPESGMEKGEEFEGWVKLKNTGNVSWTRTGENQVVLMADHNQGRKTTFVQPAGIVIAEMEQEIVAPGETATFNLKLKAPRKPGYYQEYFTPVAVRDEIWMADTGMYFETVVYDEMYGAQVVSTSTNMEWKQGKSYVVWMKVRNLGKQTWTQGNMSVVVLREQDLKITGAELAHEEVEAGQVGMIRFTATVAPNEDIERKNVLVQMKVDGHNLFKRYKPIYYDVVKGKMTQEDVWGQTYVSGKPGSTTGGAGSSSGTDNDADSGTSTSPPANIETELVQGDEDEPQIRIKISFSGNPQITANGSFEVYAGDYKLVTLNAGDEVEVTGVNGKYQVKTDNYTYIKTEEVRFVPKNSAILEIANFNHPPGWNPDLNDNEYRGVLEVRDVDGILTVINELDLEDYLKGLGEVSNGENAEKIKAIMVAARTYAKYYTINDKFENKPYHLDDDPNVSQKYLGYGLEKRSPDVAAGVEATRGQVVTYNNDLVKTPYFNQSDGTSTKNASDVWGWDAPYLVSVSDSYCGGDQFLGHGVGLSGCGAKGMAEAGYNYLGILKHYYTGIEVTDLY